MAPQGLRNADGGGPRREAPCGRRQPQPGSQSSSPRGATKEGKKTKYYDVNPKAFTSNELYGYVNLATRDWKDGLLSSTMRDLANAPDSNPKWIILDGDLDANWIENMNSVMDDNRLLTLASNERIRLLVNMKMMFEIRDLVYASPATVTRAGVLFISDNAQWKNYVQSWIDAWIAEMPVAVKADARAAFHSSIHRCASAARRAAIRDSSERRPTPAAVAPANSP